MKKQNRVTFVRCGVIDPLSVAEYEAHDGFKGLKRAFEIGTVAVVEEVTKSGLRGRGGAGFPTGIKWKTVADCPPGQKYVVVNADEGDSGTFADRMIMEGDPLSLIEGMLICGYAVGASKGYIYLRSEYPIVAKVFQAAIEKAHEAGWLGKNIKGSGFDFDVELRIGAGPMFAARRPRCSKSLEGKRGIVRAKPPLPAHVGLFGKPTVINNVLSMATIPMIMEKGAKHYADLGVGRSRGTMPLQIAGNVKYGGLFETDFGIPLGVVVNEIGGGTRSGRPVRAVQVGGPLGAYVPCRFSTFRSTMKPSRPRTVSSAMAASSFSTTPSTWPGWRASAWSSAPSKAAANARRAGSDRRAASRPSTRFATAWTSMRISSSSRISATR